MHHVCRCCTYQLRRLCHAPCRYGGDAAGAEKVFLKALGLVRNLPVQNQRQSCFLYWAFADVVLQQAIVAVVPGGERGGARVGAGPSCAAVRAVAAFILCAGARSLRATVTASHSGGVGDGGGGDVAADDVIAADLNAIKRLCKHLHSKKRRAS